MPKEAKPLIEALITKYRQEVSNLYARRSAVQGQGDRHTAEKYTAQADSYNKVIRDLQNMKKVI